MPERSEIAPDLADSPYGSLPAAVADRTAQTPHILIVDDIRDNRAVLSRRFSRRGYRITEAECGEQALDLLETETFDAVLLDVVMPGIDGIEVLRRARQRYSPSELPIIMVTAKTESQDVVQAFHENANDYLTKPVDFAVALARVNVQVKRKQAEQEVRRVSTALRESNEVLVTINDQLRVEINQREQSEAHSRYLAYHDSLTGLANRLQFRQELEAALASQPDTAERLAVLFIDLDGFKSINDTIGHSIGDLLLKAVASDLRQALGERDCLARLGGDEFAIFQREGQQPGDATALAIRVIDVVKRPRLIESHYLSISASIGIAVASAPAPEPDTLLKHADLAMYRAKAAGRGTYRLFDPEMALRAQNRRKLELDLRQALMLGQFELFYQPLVELKSQRISGFEALLRWHHPERGIVSPVEFIPVAEETGLIAPLGEWVLRQACRDAARWPDTVKIAVNVSPAQFTSNNLVPCIVEVLASSGLRPSRLEIEITESVLLTGAERTFEVFKQLRTLGVRISMDDFGTGYSSLSYLQRFKFDKIKVDRSFVSDIALNRESAAIINAIAGLATEFGMTMTAEGVETPEQMNHLASKGCTEGQGWLFSKAVEATAVPRLLHRFGIVDEAF